MSCSDSIKHLDLKCGLTLMAVCHIKISNGQTITYYKIKNDNIYMIIIDISIYKSNADIIYSILKLKNALSDTSDSVSRSLLLLIYLNCSNSKQLLTFKTVSSDGLAIHVVRMITSSGYLALHMNNEVVSSDYPVGIICTTELNAVSSDCQIFLSIKNGIGNQTNNKTEICKLLVINLARQNLYA